jgi:hypothetical protein
VIPQRFHEDIAVRPAIQTKEKRASALKLPFSGLVALVPSRSHRPMCRFTVSCAERLCVVITAHEFAIASAGVSEKSYVFLALRIFGDKLRVRDGTAPPALLHCRGRASEFLGGFPPDSRRPARRHGSANGLRRVGAISHMLGCFERSTFLEESRNSGRAERCGEYSPTIPIFLSRLLSRFASSIRVIGRVPNFRLWPTTTSFRHHPSTASILNRNGRGGRPSTF